MGKIIYSEDINKDILQTTDKSKIFTIVSMIYVSDKKLFGRDRSDYSPEQRYQQTISQLEFIEKNKTEDMIVILQELSSNLNHKSEYIKKISEYCDCVILYCNNSSVKYYAYEQTDNKGLSEMYLCRHIYDTFLKDKKFYNFTKMTGRYNFLQNFSFKILENENIFKYEINSIIHTSFYTIHKKYLKEYCIYLNFVTRNSIEIILTQYVEKFIDNKFCKKKEILGIVLIPATSKLRII